VGAGAVIREHGGDYEVDTERAVCELANGANLGAQRVRMNRPSAEDP
jgi:hypothetical protein